MFHARTFDFAVLDTSTQGIHKNEKLRAALALKQGGYDWGVLAYAVGFGGSMIWFGSSSWCGALEPVP